MDGGRFDRIVRRLAASGSRRRLLQVLALLASLVTSLAAHESQAGKGGRRRGGKHHGRNRVRRRHARRRHARKKNKQKQKPPPSREPCPLGQSDSFCAANQICVEEACQECTVTCDGEPTACGTALQAAIDAAAAAGRGEVLVCPGRYGGNFHITAGVALVGAGDGDDPAVDTILDAQGEGRVLEIASGGVGDVLLALLRITGGHASNGQVGGGIFNSVGRTLIMTRCAVSGNQTTSLPGVGGGIANEGTLTLTDCLVADNNADGSGGGIHTRGDTTLAGATEVRGNSTGVRGGGILVRSGAVTIGADCRVTENRAQAGPGGIYIDDEGGSTVVLESDQIVTDNNGGNCFPVDTIPNCVG